MPKIVGYKTKAKPMRSSKKRKSKKKKKK